MGDDTAPALPNSVCAGSGSPLPNVGEGPGGEGDRGAVSVSRDEKSITSVILTITATLVRFRIAKMGDVGETVHGQAAGWARPMKTRCVKCEDGCVNDVPSSAMMTP